MNTYQQNKSTFGKQNKSILGFSQKNINIASNERLACIARLIFNAIFLSFFLIYHLTIKTLEPLIFFSFVSLFSVWNSLIIGTWIITYSTKFNKWISIASVLTDILAVTIMYFLSAKVITLNFCNNLIPSLYFIIIALAAIHRNEKLVVLSGLFSALLFLMISGIYFLFQVKTQHTLGYINNQPVLTISFIDQVCKAVTIAFVGWLIGHLCKNLKIAELKYQILFEHIPDGIVVTDDHNHIKMANSLFLNMINLPLTDLKNKNIDDYLTVSTSSINSTSQSQVFESRALLKKQSGNDIFVMINIMKMTFEKELHNVINIRNVSKQVVLERQVAQIQKIDTLGKLAGGLAHDFNNLLAAILGAASLAKKTAFGLPDLPKKKLLRQMSIVAECGDNARDVINKLLEFSKASTVETKTVNLFSVLKNVETICNKTFGSEYQFNIVSKTTTAPIEANSDSLLQAFLNMCINAKESMINGGTITVQLKETIPSHKFILRHPSAYANLEYWCIIFSDTGIGMSRTTLENALEPFFSTKKAEKKGSGLGLPISYTIIQQHKGFMDIESIHKKGTTIRIYLPQLNEGNIPDTSLCTSASHTGASQ